MQAWDVLHIFTYQACFAEQPLPKCIHLWIDPIRIILFRFIGRINFKGHRFTRCKIIHCRSVSCFHRTSTLIDRRQNHRHFTFSFICNNSSYFIGTIRAAQIGYHQFRRRGGLYLLLVHKYSIGDNAVQFIADPRDSFIFSFERSPQTFVLCDTQTVSFAAIVGRSTIVSVFTVLPFAS